MPASITRKQVFVCQNPAYSAYARAGNIRGNFEVWTPLGTEDDYWMEHKFHSDQVGTGIGDPQEYYKLIGSQAFRCKKGMYVSRSAADEWHESQISFPATGWSKWEANDIGGTDPGSGWTCSTAGKILRLTCPAGTTAVYILAHTENSGGILTAAFSGGTGTILVPRVNTHTSELDGVAAVTIWPGQATLYVTPSGSTVPAYDFHRQWLKIATVSSAEGAVIDLTLENVASHVLAFVKGFLIVGDDTFAGSYANPVDGVIDPDSLVYVTLHGDDDYWVQTFNIAGGTAFYSGESHWGTGATQSICLACTETYAKADGTAVVFQTVNGAWAATRVVTESFTMTRNWTRSIYASGGDRSISAVNETIQATADGITHQFRETFNAAAETYDIRLAGNGTTNFRGLLAGGFSLPSGPDAPHNFNRYCFPPHDWTWRTWDQSQDANDIRGAGVPGGRILVLSDRGIVIGLETWYSGPPSATRNYLAYDTNGVVDANNPLMPYGWLTLYSRACDTELDIVEGDVVSGGSKKTFTTLAGMGPGFAAGQADQLAADVLAVAAELGNMTTAVVDLLDAANDGTLDMGLYTLSSGIVWPAESHVTTAETAWGPTGDEYAGALDMSLYRIITSGAPGGETPATIADAVAAEIIASATLLPQPSVVTRSYRPTFDLKDLADLHVTVVARSEAQQNVTRAFVQQDISVDIGVMQKLTSEDNAEIDPLMELVRDIKNFFQNRVLTAAPSARWVGTENEPIYLPEHIDQYRQFTSIITLTYRVLR